MTHRVLLTTRDPALKGIESSHDQRIHTQQHILCIEPKYTLFIGKVYFQMRLWYSWINEHIPQVAVFVRYRTFINIALHLITTASFLFIFTRIWIELLRSHIEKNVYFGILVSRLLGAAQNRKHNFMLLAQVFWFRCKNKESVKEMLHGKFIYFLCCFFASVR